MRGLFLFLLLFPLTAIAAISPNDSIPSPVQLAEALLYGVRSGKPVSSEEKLLGETDSEQLKASLKDDNTSMAFWLNMYNGLTRLALQRDSSLYQRRGKFFRTRSFMIAGQRISLDDIEHGILRASAIKWGLGYLRKPFPGTFEKRFRLRKTDPRIHFALNCGAKSCPPIAFYTADRLDQQLELATRNYLKQELQYDSLRNRVYVPALFSWFRGDFGGRKKIFRWLESYRLIPAGSRPKIIYKPYNWELYLDNEPRE